MSVPIGMQAKWQTKVQTCQCDTGTTTKELGYVLGYNVQIGTSGSNTTGDTANAVAGNGYNKCTNGSVTQTKLPVSMQNGKYAPRQWELQTWQCGTGTTNDGLGYVQRHAVRLTINATLGNSKVAKSGLQTALLQWVRYAKYMQGNANRGYDNNACKVARSGQNRGPLSQAENARDLNNNFIILVQSYRFCYDLAASKIEAIKNCQQ